MARPSLNPGHCSTCGVPITLQNVSGIRNDKLLNECRQCNNERSFRWKWRQRTSDDILTKISERRRQLNILTDILMKRNNPFA